MSTEIKNTTSSQHDAKLPVMRRFFKWWRIRIIKTNMYNLECDMMFFAIPFSQYEREMEAYQKQLDYISNGT